ncbi:acyltransferase (plasmid) [Streptomyces sp. NBC_00841]|uniref:DapH/DapD/GlmU-related protein n=1 Tax=Streptomyces sp. NBC_00841 TaxID=2975847 RepID=UPI002DD81981|nr:DapH/DapD/GlmU-related protein [Streptomyces sp. NBC_00841]WSA04973.1 acyltransferase [Streptomyces sp. NBC_00841]
MAVTEGEARPGRFDHCPWEFWSRSDDEERAAQLAHQEALAERLRADGGTAEFGDRVFVSPWAGVHTDSLRMGDRSYVGAHAVVTDEVSMGRNCTLNPFSTARGKVLMGDGVRVGAHTSLLGFNHGFAPGAPVHKQPLTSKGIVLGDDVWIGSHVVVVDGVTIGDHCVVGAGAVVTKDLPAWSVAAGSPARRLRDRRDTAPGPGPSSARPSAGGLDGRLEAFARRAREQAAGVLDRCRTEGVPADRPGAAPTVRAGCDAVEIADLLLGGPPPGEDRDALVERLRALQDPLTGLVPEIGGPAPSLDDHAAMYHILCVGYALGLLGSRFAHPVRAVTGLPAERLVERLDALPWRTEAWRSGNWVDGVGTALHFASLDASPGASPQAEALFGWLLSRADRRHGLWGEPDAREGWRQPVNGFYRVSRGSFAQFGLPVPYPERVVDTVLAHSLDPAWFGPDRGTACDVLDVAHPLWLCARRTGHRAGEGRDWARGQLERVLTRWQDGAGFSFALEPGERKDRLPGLQGTEMWLAVTWLLADLLGVGEALGYRPRGIHRPEPAPGGAG